MKRIRIIIAIAFFTVTGSAQNSSIDKANKKYEEFAYVDAIKTYESIVDKGFKSAEVYTKLANSYYFNNQFKKAAKWYGELFALTNKVDTEIYYRYAQSLKAVGNYEKSNDMMNLFTEKTAADSRGERYTRQKNYLDIIKINSGRYTISDAGVNTKYSDYGSTLYKNKMIFSSARDSGGVVARRHEWSNQFFTNMYAAKIYPNSLGAAEKFAKNVSTRFHEATPAFTKDGKTMYFTRNNFNEGKKGKDANRIMKLKIYKATRTVAKDSTESWENTTELPFNSDNYSLAHPALSPDGQWMYFASDMPGGFGQSDIWKVQIIGTGFGQPINLGKGINTEGKETFPFVSDDDELYFATDGYPGLGGLDIYVSKLLPDGNFDEPQNIGTPANSPKDDFAYILDNKTRTGFFSSNRDGGKGSDDIYKFKETRRLVCEQELAGVVTDGKTKKIITQITVVLYDDQMNKVKEVQTDDKGFYDFGKVDCGKGYYVRIEKEGYDTEEKRSAISTEYGKTNLPLQLSKKEQKLSVGDDLAKIVGLKQIYFDLDKWNIRPDAALELQKILDVMLAYPNMKVDIRSHTDSRATAKYNEKLSGNRARSTMEWLISKGIAKNRLTSKGYGESTLVNGCTDGVNCSEEEHQMNRRSEFIIVSLGEGQ